MLTFSKKSWSYLYSRYKFQMQICSRESSMMNFQSFLAAIEIKDEKRGSNLVSHFQNWEFKGIQNKLFGREN